MQQETLNLILMKLDKLDVIEAEIFGIKSNLDLLVSDMGDFKLEMRDFKDEMYLFRDRTEKRFERHFEIMNGHGHALANHERRITVLESA